MERRQLGSTGISVSALCLGTWMFGRGGNADASQCESMIQMAMDAGINFIDTADVYSSGDAETIVGSAIGRRRTDVVLATKVGYPVAGRADSGGLSRGWITRSLEESLRRLRTNYVDLLLLHRPDPKTDIEETLAVLDELVRAGKVRAAGCSTFPAWQVADARCVSRQNGWAALQCEQPPYSIFVRAAEADVFPVATRYDMGIMVWSPLAGGWLTGKYRRAAAPPAGSRASRALEFRRENLRIAQRYDLSAPENGPKFDAIERLEVVAREAGVSLMHLAIAFTQAHPAVTSTVIGARTPEQLKAILGAPNLRLDDGVMDRIDEVVPPGKVLNDADRGWDPPWMQAKMRRRG